VCRLLTTGSAPGAHLLVGMGAGSSVQSGAVDGAALAQASAETSKDASWIVGEGDGDMKAVIVVGAKDLRSSDFGGGADPYCIVRLGEKGVPFEEKPRGRGRRSHMVRFTTNPIWKMGMCMDLSGLAEPELSIQVYDKDDRLDGNGILPFLEVIDRDDFLGQATLDLAHFLEGAPLGEETVPLPPTLTKMEGDGKTHYHTIPLKGKEDGSYGTVQLILGGNEMTGRTVEEFAEGTQLNASSKYFISQPQYEDLATQGPIKSFPASALGADGPMIVGAAPLPIAMQGVFWLTGQGNSSALMSFGGPSNDGGGMSPGIVSEDRRYAVRVSGDRTWAFATNSRPIHAAGAIDLIYHFILDDHKNPTKCQIYPEARNFGIKLDSEWVLDFEAHLRTETKADDQYRNSVVWIRPSFAFGDEIKSAQYALVQVLDGNGTKVEPAYSDFVAQQEQRGDVFYRTLETDDREDGPIAVADASAAAPAEATAQETEATVGGSPSIMEADMDQGAAAAEEAAVTKGGAGECLSSLVVSIFNEEENPYTAFVKPPEMLGGIMQVVILMIGPPLIVEGSEEEAALKRLSDDSNWRSALALFRDPAGLKAAMMALSSKVAGGAQPGEKSTTDFKAAMMTVKDFWHPREEFKEDLERSNKFARLLAEWVFCVYDHANGE